MGCDESYSGRRDMIELTQNSLSEFLAKRDLSLRELASLIGVSPSTLSRYVRGIGTLTTKNHKKLQAYINDMGIDSPITCDWKQVYVESLKVQGKLMRHIQSLEEKLDKLEATK